MAVNKSEYPVWHYCTKRPSLFTSRRDCDDLACPSHLKPALDAKAFVASVKVEQTTLDCGCVQDKEGRVFIACATHVGRYA